MAMSDQSEGTAHRGLLTRKEAAAMLGISVNTLDKWRQEGKIGYYQPRPGCKVMFTLSHLDKFLGQTEHTPRLTRRQK